MVHEGESQSASAAGIQSGYRDRKEGGEVSRRPFRSFFEVATGLPKGPHQYQANLAECRRLPDLLAVPTGCGKTAAAVLSWAWRRRECPDDDIRRRTPRRLVYCLPMRSLVEQVHEDIVGWFANLGWLQRPQPLPGPYRPNWPTDRVPVFRLMGGDEAEEWEAHPEREAVLVGTQDMLLSRALNRGYAMKPYHWPIAFGLVNVDALWVLDEVQLMGVGRTTSVQLQQFQRSPGHLPRESLWMSATIGAATPKHAGGQRWAQPAPHWMQTPEHGDREVTVLGLGDADRKMLSEVLTGPKRVQCPAPAPDAASTDLPKRLLHYASGGRFVLVMVNRVVRAQEWFRQVKALAACDDDGPEILLLHSRFRPREHTAAMDRLRTATPVRGRIAISTQVLEAGVDLDADVLISEICPWPSLVQRLGRLNRRGQKEGVVLILDVRVEEPSGGWPSKKADRKQAEDEARRVAALPYAWSDLQAAWCRVDRLRGNASISAIEKVDQADPYRVPVEGPVFRRHHLDDLFDTDPDLSGGHLDVSGFVRGDSMDLDVAVLWRALDNAEPEDTPAPHPAEICKISITDLCKLGRKMGTDNAGWLLGLQRFSRRSGAWRRIRLDDPSIRPGDTVMLNTSAGGYDDELGWTGSEQSRPSCWVTTVDGRRSWVRSDGSTIGEIDDRTAGWAGSEGDPRSHVRRWMELSQHLSAAESKARQLAEALVPDLADKLATAGRWHDIGKALERDGLGGAFSPFQKMLRDAGHEEPPDPGEGVYYAKSNGYRTPSGTGHRFRHEVASALAYLTETDADDLVAWLVMAHHGKVRMTPTAWDNERLDDLAGVQSADRVPARAMSFVAREELRELDLDLLLPSLSHPGWQGRAVKLLAEHGPQFLAYLEALVRVADWRASR